MVINFCIEFKIMYFLSLTQLNMSDLNHTDNKRPADETLDDGDCSTASKRYLDHSLTQSLTIVWRSLNHLSH